MADEVHQFSDLPTRRNGDGPARPVNRRRGKGDSPQFGVIYNRRSHRSRQGALDVEDRDDVHLASPASRADIAPTLVEFAEKGIDLLIIAGGDGTVRDVLTAGEGVFQDDWPDVAVLPKGKTNALNVELGVPDDWSVAEAIAAYPTGQRIPRSPLAIRAIDGGSDPVLGFILGAGAYSMGVRAGQDAHRFGAFDGLAVGLASFWGIAQALFGANANPWRRGVQMTIELGEERAPLPHTYPQGSDRISVMLASTLERFPAGVKPFGNQGAGLKLAALDFPRRRVVAMLPVALTGYTPQWMKNRGFHQCVVSSFRMNTGDEFIVDGEFFPPGDYLVERGPLLNFLVP